MPPSPSDHVYAPAGWPGPAVPTGVSVENLPITDPYCTTDACKAFRDGFADDERKTPLLKLLEYGKWTVWFYSFWILLFTSIYVYHLVRDRIAQTRTAARRPSLKDKIVALFRFWNYRRPDSRFSRRIGLRQVSYGTLSLLAFTTVFFAILPWPQQRYLRERFRFGSPPLSVRCAMTISALTPLTIALAGKVNIITWMTGVGYEKLNVYHRYVAYVIFCLATIHTVPHLIAPVKDGGWSMLDKLFANAQRELSGTPLYFSTFGLAFFSIPWIRNRFYEAFKYVHIFLGVSYVGLIWWHTYGEFMSPNYIYATAVVLVFSTILRVFQRHHNIRSFSTLRGFRATLSHLHGETSRLAVQVPTSLKWKPGQHAFIRIPAISWTGNHPFSIASIPTIEKEGSFHEMVFIIRRQNGFTKKLRIEGGELPAETKSETTLYNVDAADSKGHGVVPIPIAEKKCIRATEIAQHPQVATVIEEEVTSPTCSRPISRRSSISDQITRAPSPQGTPGLSSRASTKRGSAVFSLAPADELTNEKLFAMTTLSAIPPCLRVIIDGPYGTHHRPLHRIYDTVVCVAGGSGITAPLPHVLDLTQRLARPQKEAPLTVQRIHLIWIIRRTGWLRWAEPELATALRNARLAASARNLVFSVDVYVTQSSPLSASASSSEDTLPSFADLQPTEVSANGFVFSCNADPERATSPVRPSPAHTRDNSASGLLAPDDAACHTYPLPPASLRVAVHYCRPNVRDAVESYIVGNRAIVLGCGPPAMTAELANTVAAAQRRVLGGEMSEVKVELETFGW